MALAWTLTDSGAKLLYNALYKWYNVPYNFPNYTTGSGVFFNFPNYTLDKLYYTIEALKKMYALGWFTDDYSKRSSAINAIANELYNIFAGQVDKAGIVKFCNYVYNFAKHNESAVNYFTDNGFGILDTAAVILDDVVIKPIESAVDTVNYGINYPSLESLLPSNSTLLKWGLLIGGGVVAWQLLKR